MLPLEGLVILEFCQYMAGPVAGLRLADLGARVIKIERPGSGEAGRALAIKNLFVDGDSLVFHTINRNKESYAANLKDPADLERVRRLIGRADVMTHNFRPGVMEKLGLDWESARALNPRLIYAEVTGYGSVGPWRDKPGQDLLLQSLSGLTHLSGCADAPPTPFGLAVADMLCGLHLAQGIVAALVRRGRTGQGARIEASLLASLLDFQFEVLTTWLADGQKPPRRSAVAAGHAYLGAPYGIYPTADGHLALAMGSVALLAELLECKSLGPYAEPSTWFRKREQIQAILTSHLATRTTADWLSILEPADIWCADVYDYDRLLAHAGYRCLGMDQEVRRPNGAQLRTTRCPIRIDGERLYADRAAPRVGEHNAQIEKEFMHA